MHYFFSHRHIRLSRRYINIYLDEHVDVSLRVSLELLPDRGYLFDYIHQYMTVRRVLYSSASLALSKTNRNP